MGRLDTNSHDDDTINPLIELEKQFNAMDTWALQLCTRLAVVYVASSIGQWLN